MLNCTFGAKSVDASFYRKKTRRWQKNMTERVAGEYGGREVARKSLSREVGENGGKKNARQSSEQGGVVIMQMVGA
jgi:hypothetical protein